MKILGAKRATSWQNLNLRTFTEKLGNKKSPMNPKIQKVWGPNKQKKPKTHNYCYDSWPAT